LRKCTVQNVDTLLTTKKTKDSALVNNKFGLHKFKL